MYCIFCCWQFPFPYATVVYLTPIIHNNFVSDKIRYLNTSTDQFVVVFQTQMRWRHISARARTRLGATSANATGVTWLAERHVEVTSVTMATEANYTKSLLKRMPDIMATTAAHTGFLRRSLPELRSLCPLLWSGVVARQRGTRRFQWVLLLCSWLSFMAKCRKWVNGYYYWWVIGFVFEDLQALIMCIEL